MNKPYHLDFMKDFPALCSWLNLNGFSMVYSVRSFELNMLLSMWTDSCNTQKDMLHTAPDAKNSLMINYCLQCKTVEVYGRGFLGAKGTDGDIEKDLESLVHGTLYQTIEKTCCNDISQEF